MVDDQSRVRADHLEQRRPGRRARPAGAPTTTVLDEVAAAGYAGDGAGRRVSARSSRSCAARSQTRGLTLPSAWCGLGFFRGRLRGGPGAHAPAVRVPGRSWRLVRQPGRSGHARTQSVRLAAPTLRIAPRLSAAEWDQLAERVCQAAEIAREHGLQATFHLHAGTWVETRADLEELLRRAPAPLVKLCWDVGHAMYGGIDPIAVVRDAPRADRLHPPEGRGRRRHGRVACATASSFDDRAFVDACSPSSAAAPGRARPAGGAARDRLRRLADGRAGLDVARAGRERPRQPRIPAQPRTVGQRSTGR